MRIHELAQKVAPTSMLANIPRLVSAYYTYQPDVSESTQQVAFGTSGYRGTSLKKSFKHTRAPGNQAPLGGLKVVSENGWFAARPSGTEDIYKIYAESFKGRTHLKQIQEEAQEIVGKAFHIAGPK